MMDSHLHGEVMAGSDDDVVNLWLKTTLLLDDCINKDKLLLICSNLIDEFNVVIDLFDEKSECFCFC